MPECPDGLSSGFGVPAPVPAAICFVKSYFGIGPGGLGSYRSGSGMLFDSGTRSRHVVTAAHNLYDHDTARLAVWTSLYFGRAGGMSMATRDATAMFVPDDFRNASEPPAECDYGVLRINPLGPDRFPAIPLAVSTATAATEKLLIGYPDDGACQGRCQPYNARFWVTPLGATNYAYTAQDTYVGMSGGPLLTNVEGSGLRCFGVHIRGAPNAERAIRFAQPVYDQIMHWV